MQEEMGETNLIILGYLHGNYVFYDNIYVFLMISYPYTCLL